MTDFLDIEAPLYSDYVLDSLLTWRRQGLRTALLTLVDIDGVSPRPLGSQIAVAEDGRAIGAITGGCAEQALVLDALTAITRGTNHIELYGEGSRYKDIVLPCGSGIHVAFDVTLADDVLAELITARQGRRPAIYTVETPDGDFERLYTPQLRTVILGRGNIVPVLAQLATLAEFDVMVYTPDDTTLHRSTPFATVSAMQAPTDWDTSLLDAHTALISLFHEHDFEPDILAAALRSTVFYIGALGSRQTHRRRMEILSAQGWSVEALARIHGPVGLDIGARTPPEIALSIIAEIVRTARFTSKPGPR